MKNPITLRMKAKQEALDRQREEWYDRYLDQEYSAINLQVVSQTCLSYNPQLNPMCRSCKFYMSANHVAKFGHECPIWLKVFGHTLREFVKKMAVDGQRFTVKTMAIWNARRINMPASTRFKTALNHPSAPKERRNDGLPTVEWDK